MKRLLLLLLFLSSFIYANLTHDKTICTISITKENIHKECDKDELNIDISIDKQNKQLTIQDSSGTTSFSYNKDGNIIQKQKTINDQTFTQSFTYNDQGKLISKTLPSGKTIEYTYNQNGELESISLDSQTIIEDIKTSNLGLLSYTYANGATHTREYDTNGRVVKLNYPNYTETIDYNPVSNIVKLQSNKQTKEFDYDLVDRVVSYKGLTSDEYQRFSYDANGNRLSLNQEINKTVSYLYKENSNILQTINYIKRVDENTTEIEKEINLQYDAIGNIIKDANHTYSYDAKNRLTQVDNNITYKYDYDNKRVSKSVNGVTTYFIYDSHKLLGEYKEDGEPIKEYIYYNDIPVALIQDDTIYYIYSDHLNTPRRVATAQENKIIWSWESKPFGETKPNEDVDEDNTTFTLNLRFPGQYFDKETNTHYNINRDYNPVTGRYIQSDPIGFDGGVNTYLYVGANPLVNIDVEGKLGLDTVGKVIVQGIVWSGRKIYSWFKSLFIKSLNFTPAQEARLKTIKEIIHNLEVRKSLTGEILDTGHIIKLENNRKGLIKAINALKNSLKNPNLGSREREIIEEVIQKAEEVINRIDELLK